MLQGGAHGDRTGGAGQLHHGEDQRRQVGGAQDQVGALLRDGDGRVGHGRRAVPGGAGQADRDHRAEDGAGQAEQPEQGPARGTADERAGDARQADRIS